MIIDQVRDFDEKAAARILSIAPKTLSRWRKAGMVSHYRTPTGRVRYTMDDLIAVQRRGRVPVEVAMSANVLACPQLGARVTSTNGDDAPTMAA
ncbi:MULTISPECIES: helix-turn-helix domain-containing protein [unclassified Sphingomonas]|uniref:helix-turn-helix domain-containing protein n=1 Tax=unclassified Sphingomonas TaxID=196159 RepID=UPI00226A8FD5|nr:MULTISPECIES: helix-turn-helix domain-containing protein [unclassified Sphingomonas]